MHRTLSKNNIQKHHFYYIQNHIKSQQHNLIIYPLTVYPFTIKRVNRYQRMSIPAPPSLLTGGHNFLSTFAIYFLKKVCCYFLVTRHKQDTLRHNTLIVCLVKKSSIHADFKIVIRHIQNKMCLVKKSSIHAAFRHLQDTFFYFLYINTFNEYKHIQVKE